MEKGTSVPIIDDFNVAIFKEQFSWLITNYITCMECKCKTTYISTIQELIVNIRSSITFSNSILPRLKDY